VSITTLAVVGTFSSSISITSGLAKSHHKPVSALVSGTWDSTFWIKIGRSKIPVSIIIGLAISWTFSSLILTSLLLTSGCPTFWIKIGWSNIPVSIIIGLVTSFSFNSSSSLLIILVSWIKIGRSKMPVSMTILACSIKIFSSVNSSLFSWIKIGWSKIPVSIITLFSTKVLSSDLYSFTAFWVLSLSGKL